MRVSFVISNPHHHAELMAPVARELARDGHTCQVVSLAELRGLVTPVLDGLRVRRVMPRLRRDPSAGAGGGGETSTSRGLARRIVWRVGLGPRLRWLLRGSDIVVVPNDAAFPYAELVGSLRGRSRVVLVQEGIRFPLPNERASDTYGRAGADRVCVWGEGSADHFRTAGVPAQSICVTGNPRFDVVEPARLRARQGELLAALGLGAPPLVYLSNPVDDQGFCSTAAKLELFERFIVESAPVLASRGVDLVVRLHPREDRTAFQRVIDRHLGARVVKIVGGTLFDLLACARAAVVLASTVGLEALVFDVPIAALELPGHGFPFEYVSRGAAVGIRLDAIASGVMAVLDRDPAREQAAATFLERHLAHRGGATRRIAQTISGLGATWRA